MTLVKQQKHCTYVMCMSALVTIHPYSVSKWFGKLLCNDGTPGSILLCGNKCHFISGLC